jgi:regulator of cell morphogenesis and NO signaling
MSAFISPKKNINLLVRDNFRWARALDSYGINFAENSHHSLEAACFVAGVSTSSIHNKFSKLEDLQFLDLDTINSYPVDFIIQYLKHHHFRYIKEQLPFIRRMIEQLKPDQNQDIDLISDLKFIFPLFLEDFIHHIYEEEDNLFSYILELHRISTNDSFSGQVYFAMERQSIQEHALEHSEDDDEMRGIRGIISQYDVENIESTPLKVIFEELISFDKELELHAKIENEVLFPKALNLEKRVKRQFSSTIGFN